MSMCKFQRYKFSKGFCVYWTNIGWTHQVSTLHQIHQVKSHWVNVTVLKNISFFLSVQTWILGASVKMFDKRYWKNIFITRAFSNDNHAGLLSYNTASKARHKTEKSWLTQKWKCLKQFLYLCFNGNMLINTVV